MRIQVLIASVLLLLAAEGSRAQGVTDQTLRNMTPEQREYLWQSMTPQQRAQFWRRLTPEQRQSIRQQFSPEQREAVRNRMMEERQRRAAEGVPGGPGPVAAVPSSPGPNPGTAAGPRRLSPEERQKLREQILESTRDMRESPHPHMGMEHRRNR